MSNKELLSVLMPVHRVPLDWLSLAIDSILNQTFVDFEFIIILDDPENREVENLILKYQSRDSRILFLKNSKNLGLAKSLNKALEIARGKYIARMDADDISLSNRFEKQIKYLDANPSISLCGAQALKIDEAGKEIFPTQNALEFELIKKLIPYEHPTTHPTWMFRKKDIEEIGHYRHLPHAIDYDLITRLITDGKKIHNLSDIVLKYRMHFDSLSGKTSLEQKIFIKYVQELYRFRVKNRYDTFKEEEAHQYLKDHLPTKNNSVNTLWKARMEGNFTKLLLVLKTFISSKVERKYLINLFKARLIKMSHISKS